MMRDAVGRSDPVSLMIIDVDRFKGVNDQFGHMEGDRVLQKLVETVKAKLRPADRLFRYGGEEFVVLCPGLPYADVQSRAEDIRLAVSAGVKTPNGHPVTASIGVSSTLADGAGIHELLAQADIRLYAAKSTGRNRVVGR